MVSKVRTGARRADQDLIDALTHLREAGLVPWDWIVERDPLTRRSGATAPTVAEGVAAAVEAALHLDRWGGKPCPADPVRVALAGRGAGRPRGDLRLPHRGRPTGRRAASW